MYYDGNKANTKLSEIHMSFVVKIVFCAWCSFKHYCLLAIVTFSAFSPSRYLIKRVNKNIYMLNDA